MKRNIGLRWAVGIRFFVHSPRLLKVIEWPARAIGPTLIVLPEHPGLADRYARIPNHSDPGLVNKR